MTFKIDGTAYFSFGSFRLRGTETIKAEIDPDTQTVEGIVKAKICIKGAGCGSSTIPFDEDLGDMDGTWSLEIDEENSIGFLKISNDDILSFSVKNTYNAKKYESKFILKGTGDSYKRCKLTAKFNEGVDERLSLRGKVLGQRLKYKSKYKIKIISAGNNTGSGLVIICSYDPPSTGFSQDLYLEDLPFHDWLSISGDGNTSYNSGYIVQGSGVTLENPNLEPIEYRNFQE